MAATACHIVPTQPQTCGNATLTMKNSTTTNAVVVMPRWSRAPGGGCLDVSATAAVFTPSVLPPGSVREIHVPTVPEMPTTGTLPDTVAGTVQNQWFPYQGRMSTVQVTYVLVTAPGLTDEHLVASEDMWTTLNDYVDWSTLNTATFTLNTCGADTEDYSITVGDGETLLLKNQVAVYQWAAAHPNRVSPSMLSITWEGVRKTGDNAVDADGLPALTPTQMQTVQAPWQILGMACMAVIVILAIGWAWREAHHHSKRPLTWKELLETERADVGLRADTLAAMPGMPAPRPVSTAAVTGIPEASVWEPRAAVAATGVTDSLRPRSLAWD